MIFDPKELRCSRNPERDNERRLAGQVLLQAIRDYHIAKYIIQKKRVKDRYSWRKDLDFLSREQVDSLFNGKDAWEWLTNPPLPGPERGWTFAKCCEVLELDPETTRVNAMKPSSARALKNSNCGAYHIAHLQRNTRGRRRVLSRDGGEVQASGDGRAPVGEGVGRDRLGETVLA